MVKQFNDDDTPVFLISLKAGGVGLNLTGADMVIHYDPWWNVAVQRKILWNFLEYNFLGYDFLKYNFLEYK